jgi:UDP-glucose 4-epimerase
MKYSLPPVMNVGTGLGYSVREVIDLLNSISTKKLPKPLEMARRQGDASKVCADVSLIKKTLGFQSEFTLADSIQSII